MAITQGAAIRPDFFRAVLADAFRNELDFPARFYQWCRMADQDPRLHWDAFRRVFGWGMAIDKLVVTAERWPVVRGALYRTETIPVGTLHNERHAFTPP